MPPAVLRSDAQKTWTRGFASSKLTIVAAFYPQRPERGGVLRQIPVYSADECAYPVGTGRIEQVAYLGAHRVDARTTFCGNGSWRQAASKCRRNLRFRGTASQRCEDRAVIHSVPRAQWLDVKHGAAGSWHVQQFAARLAGRDSAHRCG